MTMSAMTEVSTAHVRQLRAFNRFYTQRIGVLDPYLNSELSLTEVRVLYELAHRDQPAATELARDLALDSGYLSRILRRFESRGWLARSPSPADARQSLLKLTDAGHAAFCAVAATLARRGCATAGRPARARPAQADGRHGHRAAPVVAGHPGCARAHRRAARPAAR
jgi:DNA-binding MarR family transcriptional regulator